MTAGSFWRSAPAAELRGFDEEPLTELGLALVHGLEFLDGHVHLATNLEHVGVGAARLGQILRHVGDRAHVRRHVFAGHAVAVVAACTNVPCS